MNKGWALDRIIKLVLGIFFAAAAIFLCVAIAIFVIRKYFTGILVINTSPAGVSVTVDNKTRDGSAIALRPGKHTVKIEKDGYLAKEEQITIEARKITRYSAYLKCGDGSYNCYLYHIEDINVLREHTDDAEVASFLERFDHLYKIVSELPIRKSFEDGERYTVTTIRGLYDNQACKSYFCLSVSGEHQSEAEVTQILSERGFDIKEYEIVYEKK